MTQGSKNIALKTKICNKVKDVLRILELRVEVHAEEKNTVQRLQILSTFQVKNGK